MAGTPNSSLISVTDAKTRLLELDRAGPACPLSSPLVRTVTLFAAGTLLGSLLKRRPAPDKPSWLQSTLLRLALTAAPELLEQLLRAHSSPPAPRHPPPP